MIFFSYFSHHLKLNTNRDFVILENLENQKYIVKISLILSFSPTPSYVSCSAVEILLVFGDKAMTRKITSTSIRKNCSKLAIKSSRESSRITQPFHLSSAKDARLNESTPCASPSYYASPFEQLSNVGYFL